MNNNLRSSFKDDKITRPTKVDVSIKNAMYNISKIQEFVGNNITIMPVIKANAYGSYLNERLDFLNNFNIVAVAIVDEGVFLRKIGYKKDIFVLNQPDTEEIEKIIDNNLIVGISSDHFVDDLGKCKEEVKVHIEIGTLFPFILILQEFDRHLLNPSAYPNWNSCNFCFSFSYKTSTITYTKILWNFF